MQPTLDLHLGKSPASACQVLDFDVLMTVAKFYAHNKTVIKYRSQ